MATARSISGSSWLPWVAIVVTCGLLGLLANAIDSMVIALLVAVAVGAALGLALRGLQRRGRAEIGDPEGPEGEA